MNIYAPNKESNRVDVFKRLTTFINIHALSQSRLVLCGDFNCNINSKTDKSAKILRDCIKTYGILFTKTETVSQGAMHLILLKVE